MTIYKYYLNPKISPEDIAHDNLSTEDLHPLYAITNSKQTAKRFERDRRMDLYIKTKTKDVEPSEWRKYANQHANQVLRYYTFSTKDGYDEDGKTHITFVTILCTFDEREYVQSFCESEFSEAIFNDSAISTPPFIFNDKYLKALFILQYPHFWKLSPYYRDRFVPQEFLEDHEEEWNEIVPEYDVDEFAGFITLYGDNLSANFGLSNDIISEDDEEILLGD